MCFDVFPKWFQPCRLFPSPIIFINGFLRWENSCSPGAARCSNMVITTVKQCDAIKIKITQPYHTYQNTRLWIGLVPTLYLHASIQFGSHDISLYHINLSLRIYKTNVVILLQDEISWCEIWYWYLYTSSLAWAGIRTTLECILNCQTRKLLI